MIDDCLEHAEAGVVGDLKVGVTRAGSLAGEWVAFEITELEVIEWTGGTLWSKKVLIDND